MTHTPKRGPRPHRFSEDNFSEPQPKSKTFVSIEDYQDAFRRSKQSKAEESKSEDE